MGNVKITKLVHASLVIESEGARVLVDPGAYTWNDPAFDVTTVPRLDRILITHGHPDHLSIDFVRELSVRFPGAPIETTPDVVDTLANHGIPSTTNQSDLTVRFDAPHERTPMGTPPPNTGFHVSGVVSHPGDSHSFGATMPVLALAMAAPWGSTTAAVDAARRVGPRYVIPVHDWHLSAGGREFTNDLAAMSFADDDITVVPLANFEAVTLDVG